MKHGGRESTEKGKKASTRSAFKHLSVAKLGFRDKYCCLGSDLLRLDRNSSRSEINTFFLETSEIKGQSDPVLFLQAIFTGMKHVSKWPPKVNSVIINMFRGIV